MSPGGFLDLATLLTCFRWLVAAGWSETAGSSLVRGSVVGPRQAFGEPWEVSGMSPGGHEQVPGWLMMAMGGVGQPTSDLSLRFPMFLGHRTL